MTADPRSLRISSSMSLEQAMAEVRAYLQPRPTAGPAVATDSQPSSTGLARPSQFTMQADMIARLQDIGGRLGHVGPDSKLGPLGVMLKRAIAKVIGWYSRPTHEFDRTTVELLHQVRQDMLLLQQQIAELQRATMNSETESTSPAAGEDPAAILLMMELFKNAAAMKAFRQALGDQNPELLKRYETLLDRAERETQDLQDALLKQMEGGK